MATIYQLPMQVPGMVGVFPNQKFMVCADSLGTVTTAGYLNQVNLESNPVSNTDVLQVLYSFNQQTTVGTYGVFTVSITNGVITLNSAGVSETESTTSSATPGTIRAFTGVMVGTATTMTSGNLVGVRGELDVVGASGGYLYGAEGKVTATGTLSGSSWTAGVFGQLNIASATINAGQTAPIWGDYGTSSGTITSATGMYGIAMTNTTAAVLEAQVYLYGGATYMLLLNDNTGGVGPSYITSGGSGGLSGTIKKLAISIDGVAYYIPCATTVS